MTSSTRTTRAGGQLLLTDAVPVRKETILGRTDGTRAIEGASFPFEQLSEIAELESWRKEVHRPIYHLHKWWAQRLGSVFRAIVIGSFAPPHADILRLFYEPVRIPGTVIFDPFMGSGTTIGEVLKLGARAIGRDINPVAHFMVRNALGVHPRGKVLATFHGIERDVAARIKRFYEARVNGASVDVLYCFWVKVVACPECKTGVDLFSSYVFAQHAYPGRYPEARAVCPYCGALNLTRYGSDLTSCGGCRQTFRLHSGPAKGTKATCPKCDHTFPIAKAVRVTGQPPKHRLYAKP